MKIQFLRNPSLERYMDPANNSSLNRDKYSLEIAGSTYAIKRPSPENRASDAKNLQIAKVASRILMGTGVALFVLIGFTATIALTSLPIYAGIAAAALSAGITLSVVKSMIFKDKDYYHEIYAISNYQILKDLPAPRNMDIPTSEGSIKFTLSVQDIDNSGMHINKKRIILTDYHNSTSPHHNTVQFYRKLESDQEALKAQLVAKEAKVAEEVEALKTELAAKAAKATIEDVE